MNTAPVLLFAYNRSQLLEQTLKSLSENDLASESILYIYCDGPKDNATQKTLDEIQQVRLLAKKTRGFSELHVVESDKNNGLAKSVISGVTQIVSKYGKVIVVEDDVLLSPYFLRFMNDALIKYENDERVLSIGSWNYFAGNKIMQTDFFIRYPDSIAWATFSRAWKLFEHDSELLLKKLKEKKLLSEFNCGLSEKYFEKMLINQLEGKIDSWAIRWTAVSVLNRKLNFYPRISLSKHMGFGATATHESLIHDYNSTLPLADFRIQPDDILIEESKAAINYWRRFVKQEFLTKKSIIRRIISRLKSIY